MLAFHGDPKIKEKYLSRVRAHREADQIIQGKGWDKGSGRGCAIGCTLEGYDHDRYETELGIPVRLAQIEDAIFEGLPIKDARQRPRGVRAALLGPLNSAGRDTDATGSIRLESTAARRGLMPIRVRVRRFERDP